MSAFNDQVWSQGTRHLPTGLPECVRRSLLLVVGCGLLSGCGSGASFPIAPVSGRVTKDGAGAPNVRVLFSPSAAGKTGIEAGPGSSAVTDAEGKFKLETLGATRRSGAVVGKHFVTLTSAATRAPDDDRAGPLPGEVRIPAEFSDGSKTFDVPAVGTDKANFDLKPSGR